MQPKMRWALVAIALAAAMGGAAFYLLRGDDNFREEPVIPGVVAVSDPLAAEDTGAEAENIPGPVTDDDADAPEESAGAAAPAAERRDRAGRGRIHGKAMTPADGPRGLEISIALHRVPGSDAVEFDYEKTLAATAVATQDGAFEFKALPLGRYILLATATGYTMNGSATLTVERPEREVTLSLVPGAAISGRVINDTGEVVPGARVFVGAWDIQGQKSFAPRDRSLASQTISGEDGTFTTVNLRTSLNNDPGYKLAVKAEGYATLLSDYIRAGTQGVEFVLKPGGIVSGMLVSASDGSPLPGKTVILSSEIAIEKITGTTDAEGFFFLTDVPAGSHTPALRDDELVLVPETPAIQVTGDAPAEEIVLEAAEGGRISGRVYDRDSGDGIAEVVIFASSAEDENAPGREVKSGADGAYRFKGLRAGTYRISHRKPDGYPDARYEDPERERLVTADVALETTGIDFALGRGLTVSGRVVDESGKPLAETSVNGDAIQGNAYDYTQTKADGTFVLAGFSPGQQINLRASRPGYAMAAGRDAKNDILKLEESSITGVELVMGAESTVSGTVVDDTGRPKPGIEVYAISTGPRNRNSSQETSAADGSVKFDRLAEGEYGFVFPEGGGWSSDQVTRAQKVKVAKGQHLKDVKIVFKNVHEGGLTISGRVLDTKGNGIPRADVRLQGPWREVTSDATGNYVISGLGPGQYTITAASYSHSGMDTKQAEAGAKNVNFVLKGLATVSGRVVSAATNQPVTAFRVRASRGDGNQYYVRNEFQSVRDPEGRFTISQVEDGSTSVEVRAEGFADTVAAILAVREGEAREDVLVRIEDGVVVAGRVMDASGKGVSGAQIFIGGVPQQWEMERQRRAVSAGDGSFRLTSLPAGRADISAAHTRFASKTVSLSLVPRVENKVDIVLNAGGTIEGRITENGKTPLAGQYVYANVNNDHRQTQSDADGRYILAGLPDGSITVSANMQIGESNRSQNVTVDVKDGYVTEVNFDFRPGTASVEGTIYVEPGVPIGAESFVQGTMQTATGTTESYGTQTDASGAYRIEGMAPGMLTLRVFGRENANKRVTLDVAEGTRIRKDILLYGGGTVRVNVSGGNRQTHVMIVDGPVSLSEFSMQGMQDLFMNSVGQGSAVDGTATITGIDPGQYTAVAISIDPAAESSGDPFRGAKWNSAPVTVQDGKETSIQINL